MKIKNTLSSGLIMAFLGLVSFCLANDEVPPLTQAGQKIEAHYLKQLDALHEELKKSILLHKKKTL